MRKKNAQKLICRYPYVLYNRATNMLPQLGRRNHKIKSEIRTYRHPQRIADIDVVCRLACLRDFYVGSARNDNKLEQRNTLFVFTSHYKTKTSTREHASATFRIRGIEMTK